MARVTAVAEDYSSRTLTGDAVLSRIVLTGWGAVTSAVPALQEFTDRGRLWWRFTASTNLLELFRRPTLLSGDRVAYTSTAAASGKATLVQDSSSGFSGTCDIDEGTAGTNPVSDATGDLIVSYAHENDLIDAYAGVGGYLDTNNKWQGQLTGFEAILLNAKRQMDEQLVGALGTNLRYDSAGRRDLASIADPRQLAPVHTRWTLALIEEYRKRIPDAEYWMAQAKGLLKQTQIVMDYDADATQDTQVNVSSAPLLLS